MEFLKYLGIFAAFFVIIYVVYYFLSIRPYLKQMKKKSKGKKLRRERDLPMEVQLLKGYYKITIEKIGIRRLLRICNFVNAFFLALLVLVVLPFEEPWLKILILTILVMPTIWFVYYFLAKYLKHLEGKSGK